MSEAWREQALPAVIDELFASAFAVCAALDDDLQTTAERVRAHDVREDFVKKSPKQQGRGLTGTTRIGSSGARECSTHIADRELDGHGATSVSEAAGDLYESGPAWFAAGALVRAG